MGRKVWRKFNQKVNYSSEKCTFSDLYRRIDFSFVSLWDRSFQISQILKLRYFEGLSIFYLYRWFNYLIRGATTKLSEHDFYSILEDSVTYGNILLSNSSVL